MRCSLPLLAALAACSSSTGPRGLSGARLETIVSANQVAEGGSVQVTVALSNPTNGILQLVLGSPVTYAMFLERTGATIAGTSPVPGRGTMVLAPGARVTLRPITLVFAQAVPTGDEEAISVTPGTRQLAACVFTPSQTPEGQENCAPTVTFTVTQ